jgi:hypothetical protein
MTRVIDISLGELIGYGHRRAGGAFPVDLRMEILAVDEYSG